MTTEVNPPAPIPAGMVSLSLSHCMGYLAAQDGDMRLVEPISVYQHVETGVVRIEPEGIQAVHAAYTDLVLFVLRAGYFSAYVDTADQVLSPEFWQYPVARQCLLSGSWKSHRLLARREELKQFADNILLQQSGAAQGGDSEPDAEEIIEPAKAAPERRGPKPKNFWPKVLGYAASWLAVNGRPEQQADLEAVITERIKGLEQLADVSTVRGYAREMLDAYRQQMGDK